MPIHFSLFNSAIFHSIYCSVFWSPWRFLFEFRGVCFELCVIGDLGKSGLCFLTVDCGHLISSRSWILVSGSGIRNETL